MTGRVDQWFPTLIGVVINEKDYDLSDYCIEMMSKVKPGGEEWLGRPYTSHGTYNLLEDSRFKKLNDWVENNVNDFAISCGWAKVYPTMGWFNVYKRGDFQESHLHAGQNFSCVFYLDVQENDSKIFFNRTPVPMLENTIVENKTINHNSVWYTPTKGLLLMFKSDTMHMVEPKKTDDIRISLSYNFKEFNNE